jgi:hypothetical protein
VAVPPPRPLRRAFYALKNALKVARQASQLSNASRRSAECGHVRTEREISCVRATVGLSGDVEGASLNSCCGKGGCVVKAAPVASYTVTRTLRERAPSAMVPVVGPPRFRHVRWNLPDSCA